MIIVDLAGVDFPTVWDGSWLRLRASWWRSAAFLDSCTSWLLQEDWWTWCRFLLVFVWISIWLILGSLGTENLWLLALVVVIEILEHPMVELRRALPAKCGPKLTIILSSLILILILISLSSSSSHWLLQPVSCQGLVALCLSSTQRWSWPTTPAMKNFSIC